MSVQRRGKAWRVRWEDGGRWRSKTFDRKADARLFDSEITRRRRLGSLASMDNGTETLDTYAREVWGPSYAATLGAKTRATYTTLYNKHIGPVLGGVPLRELSVDLIARWQSDRLAAGYGPVAVHQAVSLLGNILQRAAESGRIPANPQRLVRRARLPRRAEVRPLAPATVEAVRSTLNGRDAMLVAILAYAGLRPGEALGLQWSDIRERTLLVQRSISVGKEKGTKTGRTRTVRLLAPLAADLKQWEMRCGRPGEGEPIIAASNGGVWGEQAYMSWRRQAFAGAVNAAGVDHARPYDLRHSFASLLLHEGRSVIYVARQLGHGAGLTLSTYGHVIDELEDQPRQSAETVILAARSDLAAHFLPIAL